MRYGFHAERVQESPMEGYGVFEIFESWMEDWKGRVSLNELNEERGEKDLPDFKPIEDPDWRLRFPR